MEASDNVFDPETIAAKLSTLNVDQKSLFWRLYNANRNQASALEARQRLELIKLFKATTADIETDIYRTFVSFGKDQWDYSLVRRVGRDKQLLDQINDRIKALGGQLDGSLSDGLLDSFKKTWLDSAYRLDSLTPGSVDIKMGLLPDREIVSLLGQKWSGATFSDRLGLITADMANEIKSQIIKSMMSEESWQQTAKRIRGEMGTSGTGAVWRSEAIARTELAHAQTLANTALYDENKDIMDGSPIWAASAGACLKICQPKNGRSVLEVGYPPEDSHPNCTCDIIFRPKSWRALGGEGDPIKSTPPKTQWASENDMYDVIE